MDLMRSGGEHPLLLALWQQYDFLDMSLHFETPPWM